MITVLEKRVKDSYYIKLDVEDLLSENVGGKKLSQFNVSSIVLTESMMSLTPSMNVKFVDHHGTLMTSNPITPKDKFTLYYGKTEEDSLSCTFRYSSINIEPLSGMKQEEYLFSADMVLPEWKDMFISTYSRSWSDIKCSEVIENITESFGYSYRYIEPTINTQNMIQPDWTNKNFIKWLSKNSENESGIGGYVYYATLENEFYFRTIEDIITNSEPRKIEHQLKTADQLGFNYSKFTNNYMNQSDTGLLGTSATHFDYSKKEFITKEISISDIKQVQMAESTMVHEDDSSPSYNYYGGRDIRTNKVVENDMTSSLNSMVQSEIIVQGRNDIHVGDVIELVIPVSREMQKLSNSVINQMYSGYWIVWKVSNIFDIKNEKYITKIFMMSDGVNNMDSPEFIETSKGKHIK